MLYTLLGKKIGMTQVYDENNILVPVTVIEAGPCPVTQVKTRETDGYDAIQVGFGKRKDKRTSKGAKGHFDKAGVGSQQTVSEIRCKETPAQAAGDVLTVDGFNDVPKVDIIATTKGRGFQGVMKRWGMHGQPASHGHMMHRRPGSIGQCQWPGEVDKGKKMPGHMGTRRRTVQNLRVVKIVPEKNLILVRGSIPGANGETVIVRQAKKQRKAAA